MDTSWIKRVAVVGAGTVGSGWATFFTSKGFHIQIFDADPDVSASVSPAIRAHLEVVAGRL